MNSRERVSLALQHKEPDRVPLDLGGTTVTGMHISTVYRLRQALGLHDGACEQVCQLFFETLVEGGAGAGPTASAVVADLIDIARGRSTPVNAWWGSFDLAVNLFSGRPAQPPSDDFIMRNAMDAQEVAIGWWPGDARHGQAAFYAYAHPAVDGFDRAALAPDGAHWDGALGEYVLEWDDVRSAPDPHAAGLEFARSAFRHACSVCGWDMSLAASAEGNPPPVR